jgi:hypothetical protein
MNLSYNQKLWIAKTSKAVYPWGSKTPERQEAVERIRHVQAHHQ